MAQWQPIDTAPRETWVLILTSDGIFECQPVRAIAFGVVAVRCFEVGT